MKAKVYRMSPAEGKIIEPVVRDESAHILHMVLPAGEGLPVHTTNANVYMAVILGTLTITLDGETETYPEKTVLNIPMGVTMDARNEREETLELMVVKAPAPRA
jgi:mannose-6-phosphate isomerase-like protein (cupin superfamily)